MIAAVRCDCLNFVIRLVRAVLDGLRLALARDTLGPAPADDAEPARRSVFRTLIAPEVLPRDPEPPPAPRRRGRLAALFAFERLDDSP